MFLDLVLDRQAVRVPAGFSRHVVAAHGLVARVDVLEAPGQDVMDTGLAVCGRWPFIEREQRPALAHVQRLLEDVVLAPEFEYFGLDRRPVVPAFDFAKTHDSQPCSCAAHGYPVRRGISTSLHKKIAPDALRAPGAKYSLAVPPGSQEHNCSCLVRARIGGQPAGPTQQRFSGGDSGVIFGGVRSGARTLSRSLPTKGSACLSPSTSSAGN